MIYTCPTCNKTYKRYSWALKHQNKTGHAPLHHSLVISAAMLSDANYDVLTPEQKEFLKTYMTDSKPLFTIPAPKVALIGTVGRGMNATIAGLMMRAKTKKEDEQK